MTNIPSVSQESPAEIAEGVGAFLNANAADLQPGAKPAETPPSAREGTPASPQPAAPAAPQPAAPAAPQPAVPAASQPPVAPQRPLPSMSELLKAASPGYVPEPVSEPVPEPAAEPEDDPDAPSEAQKDGKERNAWTRIKNDLKSERAKRQALQKELEAEKALPKAKPEDIAELEALRKSVQDYENQIGQIEITRSKSFQTRYDAPILNARGRLQRTLAALSDRSPEESGAFVQSLEQCKSVQEARELVSGESADVKGVALQAYMELQELHGTRSQAIQDWRNTRPVIETEEEKMQVGERLRQVIDATAAVLPKLAAPKESGGDASWIFMDQPDDVEWTDRRNGLVSSARAILRDAGVTKITADLAKAVMEGAAAPLYREFGEAQFARANELQGILDRRNRAMARVNGGGESSAPQAPAPVPTAAKPLEGGIEGEVGRLVDTFHANLR